MGLMEFMQSPTGKRVTGVAYSLGASIVIIGALFKIMHWPGAGVMLTIGMGTEAILYKYDGFDASKKQYAYEDTHYMVLGTGSWYGQNLTTKVLRVQLTEL